MPISNPLRFPPAPDDFTSRLPQASAGADPGMVVQPYIDLGYGLHNTPLGNLNQSPGQVVGGYLPASFQGAPNYQQQQQNALSAAPAAGSMFDRSQQNAAGLLVPGNINIHQRPVVRNADGTVSTVRSMTFTTPDGRAVLVPSVIAGRGIVSPQEAYKYYQQTGQHLGVFDTPENADAYAQMLHEQQASEYQR